MYVHRLTSDAGPRTTESFDDVLVDAPTDATTQATSAAPAPRPAMVLGACADEDWTCAAPEAARASRVFAPPLPKGPAPRASARLHVPPTPPPSPEQNARALATPTDAVDAWIRGALGAAFPAPDLLVSELDDAALAARYQVLEDPTFRATLSPDALVRLGFGDTVTAREAATIAGATWPQADVVSLAALGAGTYVLGPNPYGKVARADFYAALWASETSVAVALAEPGWLEDEGGTDALFLRVDDDRIEARARAADAGCLEVPFEMVRRHDTRALTAVRLRWPDFSAPRPEALAAAVRRVARARGAAPVVVHCGAGIGRSGTFVLAAALVHASPNEVPSLRQALRVFVALRMQRRGAIETSAQFVAALRAAALLTGA